MVVAPERPTMLPATDAAEESESGPRATIVVSGSVQAMANKSRQGVVSQHQHSEACFPNFIP